jgi:hypothetical protein
MICKLCGQYKDLQESHVFPKFVFRWLREKGGNYIRKPDNPNIRHQDGLKQKMLCCDCEQLFSKYENVFSRDIFYPHVNQNKTSFEYDGDLYKFSLSVLWRVLHTGYDSYIKNNYDFIDVLNRVEKEWREYLIDSETIKPLTRVYLFFTSHRLNYEVQPVKRFLQYYARSVDGDIFFNHNTCFLYAKLARVILIGEIQNPENIQFTNAEININGANFSTLNLALDNFVKQYLVNRVLNINKHFDQVSDKQREVAIQYTNIQKNKLEDEEIFKIIRAERIMKIDPNFLDF